MKLVGVVWKRRGLLWASVTKIFCPIQHFHCLLITGICQNKTRTMDWGWFSQPLVNFNTTPHSVWWINDVTLYMTPGTGIIIISTEKVLAELNWFVFGFLQIQKPKQGNLVGKYLILIMILILQWDTWRSSLWVTLEPGVSYFGSSCWWVEEGSPRSPFWTIRSSLRILYVYIRYYTSLPPYPARTLLAKRCKLEAEEPLLDIILAQNLDVIIASSSS